MIEQNTTEHWRLLVTVKFKVDLIPMTYTHGYFESIESALKQASELRNYYNRQSSTAELLSLKLVHTTETELIHNIETDENIRQIKNNYN